MRTLILAAMAGLAATAAAACAPIQDPAQAGLLARPPAPRTAVDCADPADAAARLVCGDPGLRALDAELARTLQQAMAATGRPSTLARTAANWRREREAGSWDYDAGAHAPWTADDLASHYRSLLSLLDEELRMARALPATVPAASLGQTCVGEAMDQGCSVTANGRARTADGQALAWQVQAGATSGNGVTGGVLLFAVDGGVLRLAGWSYFGAEFQPPVVFQHEGATLVAAEGVHAGSGSHNADVLYRIDGATWREVELGSWLDDLHRRLPPGLEVWRGVRFDWPELRVRTPLWREGDGGCCPSGGQADVRLGLDGDSLVVTDVETTPAQPRPAAGA